MTEMVTSGSMSGDARRSDGLLGESGHERRRSQQAPPVLYATARVLDSTSDPLKVSDQIALRCPRSRPCATADARVTIARTYTTNSWRVL
jgi:hypothetical protein